MGAFFNWLWTVLGSIGFEQALAARQAALLSTLAMALEKQIPAAPFIEALAEDARDPWRKKLYGLADLLESGVSIPEALEAQPGLVPAEAVMMVRAGAATGALTVALREAASLYARRSQSIRALAGWGAEYVTFILITLVAIACFVMYFIIPKFKALFEGFRTELPELTKTVIAAAEYSPPVVILLLLLGGIVWAVVTMYLFETQGLGTRWHAFAGMLARVIPRLRAPLVLRNLSFAVECGRPLTAALQATAVARCEPSLRRRLVQIQGDLAAGAEFWSTLRGAGLVSGGEVAILAAAQRAGNLAWALRGVADSIERRGAYRFRVVAEILRPVVLLAVGTVVGIFVAAMFLPVIKLIGELAREQIS